MFLGIRIRRNITFQSPAPPGMLLRMFPRTETLTSRACDPHAAESDREAVQLDYYLFRPSLFILSLTHRYMSDPSRRLSRPRRDPNDTRRNSNIAYEPTPQSPSQSPPPPSVTFSGYAPNPIPNPNGASASGYAPSSPVDGPRRRPLSPRPMSGGQPPQMQMQSLLSPPPRSDVTTQRVATGAIGGGYGPYAVSGFSMILCDLGLQVWRVALRRLKMFRLVGFGVKGFTTIQLKIAAVQL